MYSKIMTRLILMTGAWLIGITLSGLLGMLHPLPPLTLTRNSPQQPYRCFLDLNLFIEWCNPKTAPLVDNFYTDAAGEQLRQEPSIFRVSMPYLPQHGQRPAQFVHTANRLTLGAPDSKNSIIYDYVAYDSYHWSSDGRFLYFIAEDGEQQTSLFRYEVASETVSPIRSDVETITCHPLSPDWCWGGDPLHRIHLPTGDLYPLEGRRFYPSSHAPLLLNALPVPESATAQAIYSSHIETGERRLIGQFTTPGMRVRNIETNPALNWVLVNLVLQVDGGQYPGLLLNLNTPAEPIWLGQVGGSWWTADGSALYIFSWDNLFQSTVTLSRAAAPNFEPKPLLTLENVAGRVVYAPHDNGRLLVMVYLLAGGARAQVMLYDLQTDEILLQTTTSGGQGVLWGLDTE